MRFEKVSFEQYKNAISGDIDNQEYIEKLHKEYEDIKLPMRATIGSAGYDFSIPFSVTLESNESIVIPTGIRWVTNSSNVVLQIYPRSGLGFKYQIGLTNTVGIIDSDYCNSDNEGHIMIKLINRGDKTVSIEKGKGIAQGVIFPFLTVDGDNTTGIRNGGFGSSEK